MDNKVVEQQVSAESSPSSETEPALEQEVHESTSEAAAEVTARPEDSCAEEQRADEAAQAPQTAPSDTEPADSAAGEEGSVEGDTVPMQCGTQAVAGSLTEQQLEGAIEALIIAHGEPIAPARIAEITKCEPAQVRAAFERLVERYRNGTFGFELLQVAGKYQFRTRGEYATLVRELTASKPRRLSNAALETLAIVAYRQPIVKSDIERIRGVDVAPTLKTLLERGLIRIVGHQPTVGQPALYGTTEEFLKLFGLNSLSQLPTLRDLRELEREPGESAAEETEEPRQAAN